MMKNGNSWFSNLQELKDANKDYFEGVKRTGVVLACDSGRKQPYTKRFRLFRIFEEAVDFLCNENNRRLGAPSYYEYIGVVNRSQKVYFDVDIPFGATPNPYEVVDNLVEVLKKVFAPLEFTSKAEICVYQTTYFDHKHILGDPPKHSFHVVVDGYRFLRYEEMRAFGMKIKTLMNPEFEKFIDPIWTPLRQMRLLRSSKKGKFAPKEFFESHKLNWDGEQTPSNVFSRQLLIQSMITQPSGYIVENHASLF